MLATMRPCKSDKQGVLLFIYIYRIAINIDDLYLAETNITFKQKYTFKFYNYTIKQQQAEATKYFEVQATKYDKLTFQVQCPVQSVAIFKLFFVDATN